MEFSILQERLTTLRIEIAQLQRLICEYGSDAYTSALNRLLHAQRYERLQRIKLELDALKP